MKHSSAAALLVTGAVLLTTLAAPGQRDEPKGPPDGKGPPPKGPRFGPGGFPGPFGPGGMGQVRALVKQFDKDGDGRLNREERKAARAFLAKERAGRAPGGFRPGGPFGPPGGGPGDFLARSLLTALDTDKDGSLSRAEVIAGADRLLEQAKKDGEESLTRERLAEALNRLFPRPPMFGRPGGPPDGFGPGNALAAGILARADKDKDGKLTAKELRAGAEALFTEVDKGKKGKIGAAEIGEAVRTLFAAGGFGPPGGPGGRPGRENREPPRAGPAVRPGDAPAYPNAPLYDPAVLRTLFLEFEENDWEAELADFYHTDVEVPATLTVDGKKYPGVGVRFRGASSYFAVGAGRKWSFNLSVDFTHKGQRLLGYKTLNLLNSHDDPSFLSTVLYSHIARQYIPAPKANLVKVAVNGRSWGVYVNAQQFNKDFTRDFFKTTRGARWKVQGSPGGGGGLEYLGENLDDYKRRFRIKSKDSARSWKALVALCRTLNKTPLDKLEKTLEPILDVDGALRFLALDVALINNDGYWVRASDYSIYLDPKGKFHLVPHDMNEAFGPPGGPKGPWGGGPKGPRGGPGRPAPGVRLDPLVGLDDARKPLRSRLLAVPALRKRYLGYVKAIARDQLDWARLGPTVAGFRKLIDGEVEADTRRIYSLDAFRGAVADVAPKGQPAANLRAFAEARRAYLLEYAEPKPSRATPGEKEGVKE